MHNLTSVLVVEDEQHWIDIYENELQRYGCPYRVARDVKEAREQLAERFFPVAFVDIQLRKDDPSNEDGLLVLELIQQVDPLTSKIVVTAGEGRKVEIARESLLTFKAITIFSKKEIVEPGKFQQCLQNAFDTYRQNESHTHWPVYDTCRGEKGGWDWEMELTEVLKPRGGGHTLRKFFEQLIGDFMPVIPGDARMPMVIDRTTGFVYGRFWSRATAAAIVVVCGGVNCFEGGDGLKLGEFLGSQLRAEIGETLCRREQDNVRGIVLHDKTSSRDHFLNVLQVPG